MEEPSSSKKRELMAALAVLLVVVAIVVAASSSAKKNNSADTTAVSTPAATTTTTSTSTPATTATTATTSAYKDGTYSAAGSYESPGGQESIMVSVTLQNGVVTATSATSGATDPEARQYQGDFISAYKQVVVGKNIASLKVSRVAGSSLTSQGFNSAIQKIKSEAQV